MDISLLEAFVEVMRLKSFAAVAKQRNLAPSSISRAIANLEHELGIRLFQRSTRKLEPTESGLEYFDRIEPLLAQLQEAQSIAVDSSHSPTGVLRITAPVSFGQITLIPLLPKLAKMYPALKFEVNLDDAVLDLLSERIDVALRLGQLTDSNLIARRLCVLSFAVCVSPDYIHRFGKPRNPLELQNHNCLLINLPFDNSRWHFRNKNGRITEVNVDGTCKISNSYALVMTAVGGMGVVLLPRIIVKKELENGSLVELFPDYEATATDFDSSAWLLYPSREYMPLKVRVFADFFIENFEPVCVNGV